MNNLNKVDVPSTHYPSLDGPNTIPIMEKEEPMKLANIKQLKEGSIVWIHGPDPDSLPFMAYVVSVHDHQTVDLLMIHNEEYMATADDLIYWPEEHGHNMMKSHGGNTTLVIQIRLCVDGVPIQYVGLTISELNEESRREVRQMMEGTRRPAYRTGVLVRSTDDFRWDYVLEQKQLIDEFFESINK